MRIIPSTQEDWENLTDTITCLTDPSLRGPFFMEFFRILITRDFDDEE